MSFMFHLVHGERHAAEAAMHSHTMIPCNIYYVAFKVWVSARVRKSRRKWELCVDLVKDTKLATIIYYTHTHTHTPASQTQTHKHKHSLARRHVVDPLKWQNSFRWNWMGRHSLASMLGARCLCVCVRCVSVWVRDRSSGTSLACWMLYVAHDYIIRTYNNNNNRLLELEVAQLVFFFLSFSVNYFLLFLSLSHSMPVHFWLNVDYYYARMHMSSEYELRATNTFYISHRECASSVQYWRFARSLARLLTVRRDFHCASAQSK